MLNQIRATLGRVWRPRRHRTAKHGFQDQGEAAGIATSKSARRPELPASARPDAYVRPGRPSSSGVRLRTTSQAMRHPRGKRLPQGRGQLLNTISIHQGPAEADGRKVPGHWEGDLVLGKRPSAVLTLVERTSGSVVLVALPAGWRAEQVRPALTAAMSRLPKRLRRSLTWDQGKEMAEHVRFTLIRGCWCSSATRVAPAASQQRECQRGPAPISAQDCSFVVCGRRT